MIKLRSVEEEGERTFVIEGQGGEHPWKLS